MMSDEVNSDAEIFGLDQTTDQPETVDQPIAEEPAAEVVEEAVAETVETKTEEPETPQPAPVAEQETVQEQVTEPEPSIPSWRLREESEKREAAIKQAEQAQKHADNLQAQLAQIQRNMQQQQAPDIFEDQDGFVKYQSNQIAEMQRQTQIQQSRMEAMILHGHEKVSEAWSAAEQAELQDPSVTTRIANSPNPWAEAVRWHEETKTQKLIGEGGIEGFRQREREALMKDPEFRKSVLEAVKQEAGLSVVETTTPTVPSLNGAPRVATPNNGDPIITDTELFNSY